MLVGGIGGILLLGGIGGMLLLGGIGGILFLGGMLLLGGILFEDMGGILFGFDIGGGAKLLGAPGG